MKAGPQPVDMSRYDLVWLYGWSKKKQYCAICLPQNEGARIGCDHDITTYPAILRRTQFVPHRCVACSLSLSLSPSPMIFKPTVLVYAPLRQINTQLLWSIRLRAWLYMLRRFFPMFFEVQGSKQPPNRHLENSNLRSIHQVNYTNSSIRFWYDVYDVSSPSCLRVTV